MLTQGFNAQNFADQLGMWWQPIILVGELLGFGVLVFAAIRIVRIGRSGGESGGLGGVVMMALAGVLLLSIMQSIGAVSTTFFGAGGVSPLAYATPQSTAGLSSLEILGLTIVRLVGLVGFIRGLWFLSRTGDDPSVAGHAITLIVGGMLALHYHALVQMIEASL